MFNSFRSLRWAKLLTVVGVVALLLPLSAHVARAEPGNAIQRDGLAPRDSLHHSWNLVDGRYSQVASTVSEPPEVTDAREGTRGACPAGMVQVIGEMKLNPSSSPHSWANVEQRQLETCTDWVSRKWPYVCRAFDRESWLQTAARLKTRPLGFCIDRFEYPNRRGQFPLVQVTWVEAEALCQKEGKRLCGEDEWTFACEGEEAMPYPYGYTRQDETCVIDKRTRKVHADQLTPRGSERSRRELDRLWQGEASGDRSGCRSSFGVYDLTGNVDEWTRSARPGERPSILKGGYWGPGRNSCRPSTRVHFEHFAYYQQGFRCCADLPEAVVQR